VADEAKNVLGNSMSFDEVASLAMFARRVPAKSIKLGMVPVYDVRGTTNLRIVEDKLEDTLIEYGLRPGYPGRVSQKG
jgi:hypothetical protein